MTGKSAALSPFNMRPDQAARHVAGRFASGRCPASAAANRLTPARANGAIFGGTHGRHFRMFKFLKRQKYKNQVLGSLYAILYLYPRGRDAIVKDYPGVREAIKSNFTEGTKPQRAALFIAGSMLANVIETLSTDQRALIYGQLQQMDMRQVRAMLKDVTAGKPLPKETAFGTIMLGTAIMMARTLVDDKEAEQSDYDMFASEVFGALAGKSSNERSSERIEATLDKLMPLPKLTEGDEGPLLPRVPGPTVSDMPALSGTEIKVKLVTTPTGIALISEDGQQITERRTLTQEDLRKVPPGLDVYRFVNLRARSGEIYSCIIAGQDAEVFGSMRAFWWSLAKVSVHMTDVNARMTRMTPTALARVHASARHMWDTAIGEAHSIDNMRDLIMPLRNVHYEVINKLRNETTNEAERLGLDVALAMVLATQSEDAKLEAHAYQCFKRFLWQPGEEPAEFQEYEAA